MGTLDPGCSHFFYQTLADAVRSSVPLGGNLEDYKPGPQLSAIEAMLPVVPSFVNESATAMIPQTIKT